MKKCIFALILGAGVLAAIPAYAATRQFSAEVDNTITTGDISITLEEYELDEYGKQIPYQNGKTVLPGEKVTKIVCITNEAEPAWIRAKAEFISHSGMGDLGERMLNGISDTWIKQGDYYYYTKPVSTGEEIRFFEEVVIPADWNEENSEKGFLVDVTAQAIQNVHFDPQFDSNDPWFGVPIEQCVHTSHEQYYADKNTEFAVIFENGVDGFIKIENDFFQNFSAMMPGDIMEDSFLIGNRFSRPLSIKFRTETPDDQSKEALTLLSDLLLTIKRGNEVLYNGPLRADQLKDGIMIADSLKQDETKSITYSIYMPKELQNASAMQQAKVRWIFSTEYTTSSGGGGGDRHRSSGGGEHPGQDLKLPGSAIPDMIPVIENIDQTIHSVFPRTGENGIGIYALLAAMLASGSGVVFLLATRFRKKLIKGELNER